MPGAPPPHLRSLASRIADCPRPYDAAAGERLVAASAEAVADGAPRDFLNAVGGCSPYLSRLMARDRVRLAALFAAEPEEEARRLCGSFAAAGDLESPAAQMQAMRRAKDAAALLIALAEIGGVWTSLEAGAALADMADAAVNAALRASLRSLGAKGFAFADDAAPERRAGICVLAMGKMGARELNYSSDIDLIVLFDPEAHGADPGAARAVAIAAAKQMVRLLSEQTADGYVFRVDLRLRPDPGVSAAAVSVRAAEAYYEAHGQNWERAAFIKARAAAGDIALGERFLGALRPFIWRKYLDYGAIEDVHSIRRQIHAVKGGANIEFLGHDIKLGRGGIREIEFLVQTQQLILGGKNPELRPRATLDALAALAGAGHLRADDAAVLAANYGYFRRVEHRLQMIDDEQTHRLPRDLAGAERLAAFLGETGVAALEARLIGALQSTHHYFAELFEREERLSSETGSLVFTGVENDAGTLATLAALGFKNGAAVSDRIRAWHRGEIRATRSARARELLTRLGPSLIEALARAGDPDAAFSAFDAFLSKLPGGVQVFSLFANNSDIFDVLIRIMTIAPYLGKILARRTHLIEHALQKGWPGPLAEAGLSQGALDMRLRAFEDFESRINEARRWGAEENFGVAARLILGRIDPVAAAERFTEIADAALGVLLRVAMEEHRKIHGALDGSLAVIALGRLGARAMTAASDVDLVFVYDAGEGALSDGPRPLDAPSYYVRLVRRFISALSAATEEGALYDVDMKLRPSGSKGPWAVSRAAFEAYYRGDAWIWEDMALLKARLVACDGAIGAVLQAAIRAILMRPRSDSALIAGILDMRRRVSSVKPPASAFDLKRTKGGLVDLDFLLARLALAATPRLGAAPQATGPLIEWLTAGGALSAQESEDLKAAFTLFETIIQISRAATGESLIHPPADGSAFAQRLSAAVGVDGIKELEGRLLSAQQTVRRLFDARVGAADVP